MPSSGFGAHGGSATSCPRAEGRLRAPVFVTCNSPRVSLRPWGCGPWDSTVSSRAKPPPPSALPRGESGHWGCLGCPGGRPVVLAGQLAGDQSSGWSAGVKAWLCVPPFGTPFHKQGGSLLNDLTQNSLSAKKSFNAPSTLDPAVNVLSIYSICRSLCEQHVSLCKNTDYCM